MDVNELIEILAAELHNIWARWFLFEQEKILSSDKKRIEKWMKQAVTDYSELTNEDKEKDRRIARDILKLILNKLKDGLINGCS